MKSRTNTRNTTNTSVSSSNKSVSSVLTLMSKDKLNRFYPKSTSEAESILTAVLSDQFTNRVEGSSNPVVFISSQDLSSQNIDTGWFGRHIRSSSRAKTKTVNGMIYYGLPLNSVI